MKKEKPNRLPDNIYRRCVDIESRPPIIQLNGLDINPKAAEYIFSGEPCLMTDSMLDSMRKLIDVSRKSTIVISAALSVFIVVLIAAAIFEEIKALFWAVLFILLTAAIRKSHNKKLEALKLAEAGQVRCFRYTFYNKLCYSYDDDGAKHCDYYADLGDFAVSVSEDNEFSDYAYGAVVNVRGKELFFLLE